VRLVKIVLLVLIVVGDFNGLFDFGNAVLWDGRGLAGGDGDDFGSGSLDDARVLRLLLLLLLLLRLRLRRRVRLLS
jgi:hypothetical protein